MLVGVSDARVFKHKIKRTIEDADNVAPVLLVGSTNIRPDHK